MRTACSWSRLSERSMVHASPRRVSLTLWARRKSGGLALNHAVLCRRVEYRYRYQQPKMATVATADRTGAIICTVVHGIPLETCATSNAVQQSLREQWHGNDLLVMAAPTSNVVLGRFGWDIVAHGGRARALIPGKGGLFMFRELLLQLWLH